LIKPLFDFENVNTSGVADLILSLKQDVGTTIKNEDEEETKNHNVDLFAIVSLLPITHFLNSTNNDHKIVAQDIFNFILSKVESFSANPNDKLTALSILQSSRFAFLINERVINLPQEGVPIALNFLLKEMEECRDEEDYDKKFEMDYVVVMNKFVKRKVNDTVKKVKKVKQQLSNAVPQQQEEILNYKYESELFNQKAMVNISYKIPYEKMNMEYLENSNEPQYFGLSFIRYQDFIEIVTSLNSPN
jgi:hypothetical protein